MTGNWRDRAGTTFAAVEAPRVWTEGNALEVELAVPQSVRAQLATMGHKVVAVPTVAGVIRQKFQTSALYARGAGALWSETRTNTDRALFQSSWLTDSVSF
jgi:gamma-glutamyltranspeptidase